ncbi:hypothetical protein HYV87_01225 [Candidatus Woesearchaeota archaeon]|nr:hypothetical protein [Candidatus Woesearchaeota archaeon]MBI2581736.1 hypothetical protein [Candidatus Woesearchaeota archaeon]
MKETIEKKLGPRGVAMDLQLSPQPYKFFGEGRVVDLMPTLIKAGYVPAGVSVLIDRRQSAPEEVRQNFKTSCFWTGDSFVKDEKGGILLTVDSPLLKQFSRETPVDYTGALKLEQRQWEELKADKERSLYLKPAEAKAAFGKGYVKKEGKFVPENKAVAKAWDHLSRGKDLQTYTQIVSEDSKRNKVMELEFHLDTPSPPVLRSIELGKFGYGSNIHCSREFGDEYARFVGVAPEAFVPRSETEVVLDEFKMNLAELRKALELYRAVERLKL